MLEIAPRPARLTVEAFERAWRAGAYAGLRQVELRDGQVLEMPPTHTLHALVRRKLARLMEDALVSTASPLEILDEVTIKWDDWVPTPDILVFQPTPVLDAPILGKDVRLVVEVSDTTFEDDFQQKRPRYAARGVPELWIVACRAKVIHRFWGPDATTFTHSDDVPYGAPLSSLTLPGLTVDTAGLPTLP